MDNELEPLNVVEIHDLLTEAGADVPVTVIAGWSEEQRDNAVDWVVRSAFEAEEQKAPQFVAAFIVQKK